MVEPYETAAAAAAATDNPEDYPDVLIKEYILKTLDDTEEIWYYHSKRGIFLPNAEPMIMARIEHDKGMPYTDPKTGQIKESYLTKYDVNQYSGHIQRRTYISRDDFNPSIEWLACDNCMINLKTGETCPFNPVFMNTARIPVNYIKYNPDHVHTLNDFRRPNGTSAMADFFKLVE
jgi:putative DNA primase/helicase